MLVVQKVVLYFYDGGGREIRFKEILVAGRPSQEMSAEQPIEKTDVQVGIEEDGERPTLVWGEQVNGLRGSVEFVPDKESYALGERVEVRYHIKNVGDRDIQIASTSWRQDHALAKDAEENDVRVDSTWFSGWPRIVRYVLKPRETAVLESSGLGFSDADDPALVEYPKSAPLVGNVVRCEPGQHFIYYRLRLPDVRRQSHVDEKDNVPQPRDWRGTLETGRRKVIITARPRGDPEKYKLVLEQESMQNAILEFARKYCARVCFEGINYEANLELRTDQYLLTGKFSAPTIPELLGKMTQGSPFTWEKFNHTYVVYPREKSLLRFYIKIDVSETPLESVVRSILEQGPDDKEIEITTVSDGPRPNTYLKGHVRRLWISKHHAMYALSRAVEQTDQGDIIWQLTEHGGVRRLSLHYLPYPQKTAVQVEKKKIKAVIDDFWAAIDTGDFDKVRQVSRIEPLLNQDIFQEMLIHCNNERKDLLSRGIDTTNVYGVRVEENEAVAVAPANKDRFQWYYLQKNSTRWVVKLFDDAPPSLSMEDIFFKCRSIPKLTVLGAALRVHAAEHNSQCSDNLQALEPYIPDGEIYQWLNDNIEYLGTGKKMQPRGSPDSIIAYTKTLLSKDENLSVLYNDASVSFEPAKKFRQLKHTVQVEGTVITAEKKSEFSAILPNGVTVELIGMCEYPSVDKQWWQPDGSRLVSPPYDESDINILSFVEPNTIPLEFAFRLSGNLGEPAWAAKVKGDDQAFVWWTGRRAKDGEFLKDIKSIGMFVKSDQRTLDLRLGFSVAGRPYEWVDFKNISVKPNFKPAVEVEGEGGWGEAVEGVQCQLRPHKIKWQVGEIPTFKVDVRNGGERHLQLAESPDHCLVQVDDRWFFITDISTRVLDFLPGQQRRGIALELSDKWQTMLDSEVAAGAYVRRAGIMTGPGLRSRLKLTPGKHTIHVSFILGATRRGIGLHSPAPIQVVSNPVEITIERALPGYRLSIDKAIREEAAFAAVCEAVARSRLTTTPSPRIDPYNTRSQDFKVVEVLFGKAEPVDRINLVYKVYGKERAIGDHERVLWIGHTRYMSLHGGLSGLKALPDTPENRKAVKAAASQAATVWGEVVEGLAVRLRAKGATTAKQVTLLADARNDGPGTYRGTRSTHGCWLKVDEKWYGRIQTRESVAPMLLKAGDRQLAFTRLQLSAEKSPLWRGGFITRNGQVPSLGAREIHQAEPLELSTGRHTVRLAIPTTKRDGKTYAYSNPVEIEILAADSDLQVENERLSGSRLMDDVHVINGLMPTLKLALEGCLGERPRLPRLRNKPGPGILKGMVRDTADTSYHMAYLFFVPVENWPDKAVFYYLTTVNESFEITGIPPGSYYLFAIEARNPDSIDTVGLPVDWPRPVRIEAGGEVARIEIQMSTVLSKRVRHWIVQGFLRGVGHLNAENVLTEELGPYGKVVDVKGNPIPYATVQVREFKANRGVRDSIAAPDARTNEQGYYGLRPLGYPYHVGAMIQEPLINAAGYRWEHIGRNKIFEGKQQINFEFGPWPSVKNGSGIIEGAVVDANNNPIPSFIVDVRPAGPWPKVNETSEPWYQRWGLRAAFAAGKFALSDIPEGVCNVRIMSHESSAERGITLGQREVKVSGGQTQHLEFRVEDWEEKRGKRPSFRLIRRVSE